MDHRTKNSDSRSARIRNVFIILIFLLPLNALTQDYNFRTFNTENGLVQSYVYSILQDAQGYLWIGTGNGLSRYNGFKFENFSTKDSLANNFITCGISNKESLWFGHINGGISFFDGKKFQTVKISQHENGPLTHFAKSPGHKIWASTYSGSLLRLEKDSGVVQKIRFKNPLIVNTFDFISEYVILAGTNSGVLLCRINSSGECEILEPVKEIPASKIVTVLKKRNRQGFFIATENDGIYELIKNGNKIICSRILPGHDQNFTAIQNLYEDSMSNLWLCSFGNGLIKLSPTPAGELNMISNFNTTNGFASNDVKTVFEDREGNIWCGNFNKGLTQVTGKTFSTIKFDNSICGNNIFSIIINKRFRWIGTENGLAKMSVPDNKIVRFYGKGKGLPKDTVTALFSINGKELWIGTGRNGLYKMNTENETFQHYSLSNDALENSITGISGDVKQVWIGTKKGLCNFRLSSNEKTWYSINKGLPHNMINSIYLDKTGKLWVSTHSNTLAYIKDNMVFKVILSSSNSISTLGPITEDMKSRIWVGSNGSGVFLVQRDSIVNLTSKENLASDYCYSILCDGNNNIWVGHKSGLSRIRTTDFQIKPISHLEYLTDSYVFNPNATAKDLAGKIWFGSDKGIVINYQPPEQTQPVSPVLGITSIKINDEDAEYKNKITLSPGKYKIKIEYIGISLKEPSLVSYQYKMAGYDQWSEVTKNTAITFNHITEGNYTFILKASNGDGVVTEKPLTIDFVIKKPVWKSLWFFPSVILILACILYLYILRRERKLFEDKRILENKVLERTSQIQQQKDEIERQRDLINEKNTSITSSIRYASHIQKTIMPSLSYINELFPENFILCQPKDIVSGDFYWVAEKDNKIIFTVADCTGHGVPGALMSLLGITLLNEIVTMDGITQSDNIVNELKEKIIHTLKQDTEFNTNCDGIELALCVLDRDQNCIQFTGAMTDIVFIHNGNLNIVKADRLSVCYIKNLPGKFSMKELGCCKGDVIYLFSDGFCDQFGGDCDKKFMTKRFHQTLLEIHMNTMQKQKEILTDTLKEWMNGNSQTDDITIMGIRF